MNRLLRGCREREDDCGDDCHGRNGSDRQASSLMVPTEILAEQHMLTIEKLLQGTSLKAVLLTGSMNRSQKKRKELLATIESGEANLVIGTHALFQQDVNFKT